MPVSIERQKRSSAALIAIITVCIILMIIAIYVYIFGTKSFIQNELSRALSQIDAESSISELERAYIHKKYTDRLGSITDIFFRNSMILILAIASILGCFIAYVFWLKRKNMEQLIRMHEQLKVSQQRYELIMEQTQDVVFDWNVKTGRIFHSSHYQSKFGSPPDLEKFPQNAIENGFVHDDDISSFLHFIDRFKQGCKFDSMEFRLKAADGSHIWCRFAATTIWGEDSFPSRVVGLITDIDRQKQQIEQFKQSAQRDSLTNFYNKMTTQSLIQHHLDTCTQTNALMVLDIDNFKGINDTLGHICGDAVLGEISTAINSVFRSSDIVGRIGGDEFAILMTNVPDFEAILSRAKQVLDVCERTISRNGATHKISCSIGVALSPTDGTTFEELYQKADIALYTSKKQGKNRISFSATT